MRKPANLSIGTDVLSETLIRGGSVVEPERAVEADADEQESDAVAAACDLLCSDRGGFVTGQVIHVNGGHFTY